MSEDDETLLLLALLLQLVAVRVEVDSLDRRVRYDPPSCRTLRWDKRLAP